MAQCQVLRTLPGSTRNPGLVQFNKQLFVVANEGWLGLLDVGRSSQSVRRWPLLTEKVMVLAGTAMLCSFLLLAQVVLQTA